MRVNLNVSYQEKDKVKRLGAKWDVARKVWYVENLENLRPFLKWMPRHLTYAHGKKRRRGNDGRL